jgi:hypothetical protein
MLDTRKIIALAANDVRKDKVAIRDHDAIERVLLRIAPEIHEMCDEVRRELVAATVTACEATSR